MRPSRFRATASAILAAMIPVDAGFSNVQISQFVQAGLDLSFLMSWDTANSTASVVDSVDIWLETRQGGGYSLVETLLKKGLGVLPEAEAPFANPGEGISNVNILRVDQNGSSLTFSVAWADGGGVGGFEDTSEFVDVWLAAYQSDPPAWVELSAGLHVENERLFHETDMDWSPMGWDLNREGELQSCIYDTQDYDNYDCSDFVAFSGEHSNVIIDNGRDTSNNSGGSGEGGEGGTVLALVLAGGLVLSLVGYLSVTASRRKQRRKLLGKANEAEALPEDIFIRPSAAFSGAFQ